MNISSHPDQLPNTKYSGAENIWVESAIFGINVVESVLSGKNYVRSVKGMQLLAEVMSRLQWAAFVQKFGVKKIWETKG